MSLGLQTTMHTRITPVIRVFVRQQHTVKGVAGGLGSLANRARKRRPDPSTGDSATGARPSLFHKPPSQDRSPPQQSPGKPRSRPQPTPSSSTQTYQPRQFQPGVKSQPSTGPTSNASRKPPSRSRQQTQPTSAREPANKSTNVNSPSIDSKKKPLQKQQQQPPPPPPSAPKASPQQQIKTPAPLKAAARPLISLPTFITLSNLSDILKTRLVDLQKLMKAQGFEQTGHDFIIDKETAQLIADELGYEVADEDSATTKDIFAVPLPQDKSSLPLRAPIVTIMGHVDHGKTTILDYLRKSSVAASEFGGITQHIGAFRVPLPSNKKQSICFLDTPGHAAFLNMRQRGANLTDIVVLVVAADDSVMPQTKEAIKHAKAAQVPMIVAVNKCDRPDADADKVIADLAACDVDVEDYGGDTQVVRVSGKTGLGIDKLEEAIVTLAEMLDLRAPSTGQSEGWVLESQVKKGVGSVASVLVRRGTLKPGSFLVAGNVWCKVRSLKNDQGKVVREAGPGTPVEVLGWKDLPNAGDEALQADSESHAKQVVANRMAREEQIRAARDINVINEKRVQMRLEQEQEALRQERIRMGLPVGDASAEGNSSSSTASPESLLFIVKADVSGSAEAVRDSIQSLGNDKISASVLYMGVGDVTETDVSRAQSAGATILTFNVKIPKDVDSVAARSKVKVVGHSIIYRLLEDVTNMLSAQLAPDIKHKVLGEASIREVFSIANKRTKATRVAGVRVLNGVLSRKARVKVLRDGSVVFDGGFSSMKHNKDDVSEAKKDSECGLSFEGWDKFESGDKIQTYEEIVIPRHL